jgi:DTW domain-containing protein YfiP
METENVQKLNLCLICRKRLLTCVCHLIKPFETRSRFIILMHPMEFKKEKVGTGRFSHLILKNSEILVGIGLDQDRRLREILQDDSYQTVLLYPGDKALDLGDSKNGEFFSARPLQILVIDGTWPCAKKMVKLTTLIHHLPRVSFGQERISQFSVKHQPRPGCLSTVESIHQVLVELNQLGVESTLNPMENLMEVFHYTVNQQVSLASDPDRAAYRKKPLSQLSERKISKKWLGRKLFFKDSGE